jgi:CubicO group peptidase (beta-lactamase class C family)
MSYGFNTQCPSSKMSNCFGHEGSTGIMAYGDKDKKIGFVLLTNRGHPNVMNNRIDSYKSKIADAILTALGY